MKRKDQYILFFSDINKTDTSLVGGKNSALGELIQRLKSPARNAMPASNVLHSNTGRQSDAGGEKVNVPEGFAVTAKAYFDFIKQGRIKNKISKILRGLDTSNTKDLQERGKAVRDLILQTEFSEELQTEIKVAYDKLCKKYKSKRLSVAVRSSATAEDLPVASFAGQLESYLNISGYREILDTVRLCFSSLFTDRAISYRQDKRFPLWKVAISVGVQKMVRSDKAGAGVMFTLDPESGFRDLVVINAGFGLGENVVKGRITPDEYYVYKQTISKYKPIVKKEIGQKAWKLVYANRQGVKTKNILLKTQERNKLVLSDKEILLLAKCGLKIEEHFKMPMDIEWAKDGVDGKLYIVQARPETVYGNKKQNYLEEFNLKSSSKVILTGISVGNKVGQGKVRIVDSVNQISKFKRGEVLVAKTTDPAWEPIMKKAAAIITETGGRTCHAAIVSRELGVPCIVGVKEAIEQLKDGQKVTVDCSSGTIGKISNGFLNITTKRINLDKVKLTRKVDIMMNIGSPYSAFQSAFIPNKGVGLAREEFVINNYIGIHPLALIKYKKIKLGLKKKIDLLTPGYQNKSEFFIDKLAEGVGQIAAAFYPKEVIVRFSDFKTNEYRSLVGGEIFEPEEANPMIGWRGASRYYNPKFKPAFLLEIKALRKVREKFGLDNVNVMIPFCRTVREAKEVVKLIKANGLKNNKIYLMCELPVNIIQAEKFLELVDGYSIGSNDLTQLILGVDRDSSLVSEIYDEMNPAVLESIKNVIEICKKKNKKIGICGQAPSDFPEFAKFIVKNKIDSMSLNPDSVINVLKNI